MRSASSVNLTPAVARRIGEAFEEFGVTGSDFAADLHIALAVAEAKIAGTAHLSDLDLAVAAELISQASGVAFTADWLRTGHESQLSAAANARALASEYLRDAGLAQRHIDQWYDTTVAFTKAGITRSGTRLALASDPAGRVYVLSEARKFHRAIASGD